MAMVKCPKCENEISDKARKCPHCNFVLKKSKLKAIVISIVSIIVAFVVVYGAIIGIQNYQKKKEIQEYNDSVYETVISFHDAFKSADEKIRNGSYTSLEALIDTLKNPINEFDKLPINEDSEYGQYVKEVRENPMYLTFKIEYIDNDNYDLDYGLTTYAHAQIVLLYTERIVQIELPEKI